MTKPLTYQERIDKAGKHFLGDCGEHELTIALDQGLYRHLRFRNPKSGFYWFDIHTAPGTLTFRGDAGTWVFTRTEDMLAFFRGPRINPDYWQEKVVATDRNGGPRKYDSDLLRAVLRQRAIEYAERTWEAPDPEWAEDDDDWQEKRAAFYRDVVDLLRDDWLHHDSADARGAAIEEAMRFTHTEVIDTGRLDYSGMGTRKERKEHRPFYEFYEDGPFEELDHLFVYVCHAIRWGIEQYDKAQEANAA